MQSNTNLIRKPNDAEIKLVTAKLQQVIAAEKYTSFARESAKEAEAMIFSLVQYMNHQEKIYDVAIDEAVPGDFGL